MMENLSKVCQILELMSDREFKNRRDVNEVLSLKYHILHYIVKDIIKQVTCILIFNKKFYVQFHMFIRPSVDRGPRTKFETFTNDQKING